MSRSDLNGLILGGIICGVHDLTLELRIFPSQSGHCINSAYGGHLCLDYPEEAKKNRHEPLFAHWPHLRIVPWGFWTEFLRSGYWEFSRRETLETDGPGWNPGSSLTACVVLGKFLNLPHQSLIWSWVHASVYRPGFLWELNRGKA